MLPDAAESPETVTSMPSEFPPGQGSSGRHLPGHIAAALAGAGGRTDSAGQPWAGRSLEGSDGAIHNFEDDDGTPDPGYSTAVASLIAGTGSESKVVEALSTARVFVPIVAQLAEEAVGQHHLSVDKQADMALVTLTAADGRRALPVFTSTAALAAWSSEARPVAVYAARAALSAVAEGAELLVVDPGAELTFVVRRPAVWALAQQHPWVPAYEDPNLATMMEEGLSQATAVRRMELRPGNGIAAQTKSGISVGGGGAGPELSIVLYLEEGLDASAVQALVAGLNTAWSENVMFGERVDSIDLKLRRAAP